MPAPVVRVDRKPTRPILGKPGIDSGTDNGGSIAGIPFVINGNVVPAADSATCQVAAGPPTVRLAVTVCPATVKSTRQDGGRGPHGPLRQLILRLYVNVRSWPDSVTIN